MKNIREANAETVRIDGGQGEGGGQVLRSALTLSAITGTPFEIENIRAKRNNPGLARQHLMAVTAAATVCGAAVEGADVGSTGLHFAPGRIRGGDYLFDIGTAGSTTLVLQTVVPALLYADCTSMVTVIGGTCNPMAPPAQFLQRAYAPALSRLGAQVHFEVERHGFYPRGGGRIIARVEPCVALQRADLSERGSLRSVRAEALVADISKSIAEREIDELRERLNLDDADRSTIVLDRGQGPGNVALVTVANEFVTEVFSGIGQRGVNAEAIAQAIALETQAYLHSGASVGEHLADQLLLPMALAGGGTFTTNVVSDHSITNAQVIEKFLPVSIDFSQTSKHAYLVRISRR